MKRRLLLASTLLAAGAALAQGSPRPLKIVVPFGAGTSTDIVGRILADALGRQLGVAAIVENKPGAGGSIGSEQVARATDGQTLLMGTVGTHAINPSLYKRLPTSRCATSCRWASRAPRPRCWWCPPTRLGRAWPTWAGRDRQRELRLGRQRHLGPPGGRAAQRAPGEDFMHVPYRDGAQAMTELMAGNVQFMFYHPAAVMPQVRAGKLRALGASSAKRSAAAPDVPTLMEQGVKDFDLVAWFMLYAPASMPAAQRDRLREATRQVLAQPEVREKLAQQGIEHAEMNTEQLDAFARTEIAKWGEAVRRSGAQID
jgi:tripartite-type tricarboxylate transporter receptor subunit TctC